MVAKHTIGSSKRPKDACVEDGTLFGISHDMVVAVNASVEASTLTVNHAFEPEVQYVVGETLVHLILHFLCRHSYKFLLFDVFYFLFSSNSFVIVFIFSSDSG